MRQLVELHDHLDAFAELDAQVVAVLQKEDDPADLPRVTDLVGDGILVLADPEQFTVDELPLFGTYLVDPEGTLRLELPGLKGARVRTDVVLDQLAKLRGRTPPVLRSTRGAAWGRDASPDPSLRPEQVLALQWAFSHDRVRPDDVLRLFVLPRVAPGWRVLADDGAFAVDVVTPPGLSLLARPSLPAAQLETLADGSERRVFAGDVPLAALDFRAASDGLPTGEQAVLVTLRFRPLSEGDPRAAVERSFRLPIRFGARGEPRGQLYGWEGW